MNIRSTSTTKTSAAEAAADIRASIANFDVSMLIFFASWEAYDPAAVSREMHAAFPGAVVFGCSSQAELCNGKTLTGSITAMAFNSKTVASAKVEIIENLSAGVNADAAFASFDSFFKTPMSTASYHEYGGFILIDGLSMKEEEVMSKVGSHSNIMFIGGSASDGLKFEKTYVYANGKVYTNAALLAIFKTGSGIDFIKTQSVDVLDAMFTITKADTDNRIVYELDNKPAALRYAEALNVTRGDIESLLFFNPVGLVIDNDVYIRSCKQSDGDSLVFFCNIFEDSQVHLLKIKDIIPDTKTAVEDKKKELGSISGIIDFRCVLRTLQLGNEGKIEAYADIFQGIPSIGFSTYGEQLHGHINQTSTMMVFK